MKITHRQLRRLITEEIISLRESLPHEKATVFDVWGKGPWISSNGGHGRGPAEGDPTGRVRVPDPQYASDLMVTLQNMGFEAGKIKPIYDSDGDGLVDWDEFVKLLQDIMGEEETEALVLPNPYNQPRGAYRGDTTKLSAKQWIERQRRKIKK